jgi:hypothetical protein
MFLVIVGASASALAGQRFLVTDRFVGQIHRIEDINNDGDALDIGERVLWGTGLTNAAELTQFHSGFLVLDSIQARANYYQDYNLDGDALDAGESVVWTDGFANPFGIDVAPDGSVFLSDFATSRVFRAQDTNGDGDALDANEKLLYADNVPGAVSIMTTSSEQFVVAFNSGQVHMLRDTNGDGDALDVSENLTHTPSSILQVEGIAPREGGGYYAGSWFNDAIYRVRDINGDGDAYDVSEVLTYADNFFGSFNNPWGIAAMPGDDLLVANSAAGNVLALRDLNNDGDAFDIGEVLVYVDGIASPVDMVAMPPDISADFNEDGTVDAADYVAWRKGAGVAPTESNYNLWRTNFGRTAGGSSASLNSAVPESVGLVPLALAMFTAFSGFRIRQTICSPSPRILVSKMKV